MGRPYDACLGLDAVVASFVQFRRRGEGSWHALQFAQCEGTKMPITTDRDRTDGASVN